MESVRDLYYDGGSLHFPDDKYKGYMCGSWLLDPDFRLVLGPDSNIVRFRNRYRLYNPFTGDSGTWGFFLLSDYERYKKIRLMEAPEWTITVVN